MGSRKISKHQPRITQHSNSLQNFDENERVSQLSLVTRFGGSQKKSPRKKCTSGELSVANKSKYQKPSFLGNVSRGIWRAKTMMPGSSANQLLQPRDLDEAQTGAGRVIRSTDGRAVRDLTQMAGGEEDTTPSPQINHITSEIGPETTYPSADWDVVSINRRLVRDFDAENLGGQVSQGSEVGSFHDGKLENGHETKRWLRASHSATVKPCRVAWVEVKESDDPTVESVPRLSQTLIEKGLNLFDHQGFLGERQGGRRRILLANKSYLPFQVNRGQRLGVEATNQEE